MLPPSTARLDGRTLLVTGANGGLGTELVTQAVRRGARTVYAAARSPQDWSEPGLDGRVVPVHLDVTDPASVALAARTARHVDLVVNNAAIAPAGDSITGPEAEVRRIFETNFFGPLRVASTFAPLLAAHGGGTLVNVLSSAAWAGVPTAYGASKAALWAATNALRLALEQQGTHVVGVLVGMIDTPMSARWDVPKVSPADVVAQTFDGIASGALEILADDEARQLKAALSTPAEQLYPFLHEQLRSFVP